MKKISDKEFSDFLTMKPLYSKVIATENLTSYNNNVYIDILDFTDKAFKFLCPTENEIQTFKTGLFSEGHPKIFQMIRQDPDQLPYSFNKQTKKLDLSIHLQGKCQSCNSKIDFLIKAASDKDWDKRSEGLTIILQKIGQFPAYDIGLNESLKKYLNKEDQVNYKKALTCLSISYGIGSFAYFRRIIENEIKRMIKDISEIEFDEAYIVREAYENFQKDFQMSKLIDVLNRHLPMSLKELGDNPIRLLYEQLSGGIHEFTEEECVKKSQNIDILLNYVIKKISEEKYTLNAVKLAMQNLRNNNS